MKITPAIIFSDAAAVKLFPLWKSLWQAKRRKDIISIEPSKKGKAKFPKHLRKNLPSIKLRVIRMTAPDGTESVLLTNLLDQKRNQQGKYCLALLETVGNRGILSG